MTSLDNRIALVTGASGGIGSAISKALAAAGADVAVHYRSGEDKANEVAAEVRKRGRRAAVVQADLTDADAVAAMFGRIDSELGPLDIAVNNAGVDGEPGRAWELDPRSWWKTVEINLLGTYAGCHGALERMVPRKSGVIINVSSVHEVVPWAGYSAYASAKAATSMLTKTLALETAEHGVRVLGVAPGAIKTPINEDVWNNEEGLADLHSKIPMRRMGTPDEVAAVIANLASDASSYVTGATLLVDGGMALYADFLQGG